MLLVNQLVGFGANTPPARISFATSAVSSTDQTNYSFATQAIGSAASGRRVIVGASFAASASPSISSLTIGGNAASLIVSAATANIFFGLYGLQVDTGTTATIAVNGGVAGVCASIGVWALYDLVSQTATDTGTSTSNPGTDTLNIMGGGVAIGFAGNAGLGTYTWTNLAEQFDATVDGTSQVAHSGAHASFLNAQAAQSLTATPSAGTQFATLFASFR